MKKTVSIDLWRDVELAVAALACKKLKSLVASRKDAANYKL